MRYRVPVTNTRRRCFTIVRGLAIAGVLAIAVSAAAQREFRVYPSFEGDVAEAPLPPDYEVPGELVVGHRRVPDARTGELWR